MSAKKVIVFGATGAVGGAAALEAHNRGAQVFLALRDTAKPTPDLPDSLARIQADLSDPSSIEKAVKETGAKAAFVYMIWGIDMRTVGEALKKSGIDHVVFLSSWTVHPDRQKALSHSAIAKAHAEAEIAFEEVGIKHTDLRPNYFTSNVWTWRSMIQQGELFDYGPDAVDDYIAPEDIGAVAGVKLLSDEAEIIPMLGPKLISRTDAWNTVREVLGSNFKITNVSAKEFKDAFRKHGLPGGVAALFVQQADTPTKERFPDAVFKEASANVKKYTGREPIQLREWVEKHKHEADLK